MFFLQFSQGYCIKFTSPPSRCARLPLSEFGEGVGGEVNCHHDALQNFGAITLPFLHKLLAESPRTQNNYPVLSKNILGELYGDWCSFLRSKAESAFGADIDLACGLLVGHFLRATPGYSGCVQFPHTRSGDPGKTALYPGQLF